jgi:hypothetical protein
MEAVCRICLESSSGMISPCRCSGTQAFVHLECLQTWVDTTELEEARTTCQSCMVDYATVLVEPNVGCHLARYVTKVACCSRAFASTLCLCLFGIVIVGISSGLAATSYHSFCKRTALNATITTGFVTEVPFGCNMSRTQRATCAYSYGSNISVIILMSYVALFVLTRGWGTMCRTICAEDTPYRCFYVSIVCFGASIITRNVPLKASAVYQTTVVSIFNIVRAIHYESILSKTSAYCRQEQPTRQFTNYAT